MGINNTSAAPFLLLAFEDGKGADQRQLKKDWGRWPASLWCKMCHSGKESGGWDLLLICTRKTTTTTTTATERGFVLSEVNMGEFFRPRSKKRSEEICFGCRLSFWESNEAFIHYEYSENYADWIKT